jgi:Zn finger protein HypA/HybF involved in hydrogenase expression
MTERQPVHVECANCGARWVAVYAPIAVTKFCEVIKHARCPWCAGSKTLVGNGIDGPRGPVKGEDTP